MTRRMKAAHCGNWDQLTTRLPCLYGNSGVLCREQTIPRTISIHNEELMHVGPFLETWCLPPMTSMFAWNLASNFLATNVNKKAAQCWNGIVGNSSEVRCTRCRVVTSTGIQVPKINTRGCATRTDDCVEEFEYSEQTSRMGDPTSQWSMHRSAVMIHYRWTSKGSRALLNP